MVYENIDNMIADAMKGGDKTRLNVYKLIKAEMVKAVHDGVKIDDASETKLLMKMAAQREDSISQYAKGGREDLADGERAELSIINEFIPKQPSEQELFDYTNTVIDGYLDAKGDGYVLSMKDMKPILSEVTAKYSTANGKIVSTCVRNRIK